MVVIYDKSGIKLNLLCLAFTSSRCWIQLN